MAEAKTLKGSTERNPPIGPGLQPVGCVSLTHPYHPMPNMSVGHFPERSQFARKSSRTKEFTPSRGGPWKRVVVTAEAKTLKGSMERNPPIRPGLRPVGCAPLTQPTGLGIVSIDGAAQWAREPMKKSDFTFLRNAGFADCQRGNRTLGLMDGVTEQLPAHLSAWTGSGAFGPWVGQDLKRIGQDGARDGRFRFPREGPAVLQNLVEIDTSEPEVEIVPKDQRSLGLRLREFIGSLDERFPRLSHWLGGRLDIELPAIAVSLVAHLSLIVALGMAGYVVHHEVEKRFEASTVNTALPELDRVSTYQDIDQTDDTPVEAVAGSFAKVFSTAKTPMPGSSSSAALVQDQAARSFDMAKLDVQRATESIVTSAMMYGQSVSIKGTGSEHVGSTEGAVDRVSDEILRRLEKGRTLVVWAFDASGSLQAERERLAKHIETIYAHISKLDGEGLAHDGGLLTAVVAFGENRKLMTATPTDDNAAISSAIRAVPLDESGTETTFQTVAEIVRKWGKYRDAKGNAYKTMVIVVTDEVGDDESHLEEAIDVATKAKVPVFVLGSQAIFARTMGRMNYTDPKSGKTHYNLEVRQGPESLMPEQIRLPFWYGGEQYDMLDSGFGPYALSRMAGATGGIYFVTRLGQARMGFDPAAMQEYKPDWVAKARYENEVLKDPIRKAVIDAALITQESKLPGMPSLFFPPVEGTEFKEAMEKNQALAALTANTVDAALEPINAVVKYRDREASRRWQAHYDLIRGRLLATKVRCYEYNGACARMKKDALKFTKPDSNAWRLAPDEEVRFNAKAEATGKQAIELLKKVVAEHPNTPWALLAQRELKDPLGFKWVEAYVKPQPKMSREEAAEKAKKKAMMKDEPKPPPPPKL